MKFPDQKYGVLHRVAACLIAALLCAHVAQAQTALPDRTEGAQPSSQVSKKLRLVKKTTIKRSQLPAGKLAKVGKPSPKGNISSLSAVDGGCLPDSDSQQPCGGEDEFEVFQYEFIFDSILDDPGSNDVAIVEILKRVEINGQRTIYVNAETNWGEVQRLFEELDNMAFKSIGIGESDAAEIKEEAEKTKREPVRLPKVTVPTTGGKARDKNLRWMFANNALDAKYYWATTGDTAIVQYNEGGCALFTMAPTTNDPLLDWKIVDENVSCN